MESCVLVSKTDVNGLCNWRIRLLSEWRPKGEGWRALSTSSLSSTQSTNVSVVVMIRAFLLLKKLLFSELKARIHVVSLRYKIITCVRVVVETGVGAVGVSPPVSASVPRLCITSTARAFTTCRRFQSVSAAAQFAASDLYHSPSQSTPSVRCCRRIHHVQAAASCHGGSVVPSCPLFLLAFSHALYNRPTYCHQKQTAGSAL